MRLRSVNVVNSTDSSCDSIDVGVDVGGTSVRVGAVDALSNVVARREFPTGTIQSAEALASAVAHHVASVATAVRLPGKECRVGIAVPGLIDDARGRVLRAVHMPFLEGLPFAEMLSVSIGRSVVLCTDAEAATLGEYTAVTPRPRRFAHLRLGTGVACGLVLDGVFRAVETPRTTHADVLRVDRGSDAPPCWCGLHGCLEAFTSRRALERRAEQSGVVGGAAGLQRAFERGDSPVRSYVDELAAALTTAINQILDRFHPDVLSVGGGVIAQLPALFDRSRAVRSRLEHGGSHGSVDTVVRRSVRGDDAGMIGAAALAQSAP